MQAARVARSPMVSTPPAKGPARMPAPGLPPKLAATPKLDAAPPALRLSSIAAPASPATMPLSVAGLVQSPGAGEALAEPIRKTLETSLMVDLRPVRVHTDPRAASVVDQLPARAFTYGERVFLGSKEQPTDLVL